MEESANIINNTEDVENLQKEDKVPDKPCKARCKICKINTITHMEKNYNSLTIPLTLIIIYIYGFYGAPLLLLLIPLCQDNTHKCPECGEILLLDKYCNIKLQDSNKFVWLQYGNCILIFRFIYVTIFLFFIILFGIFNYTNWYLTTDENGFKINHHSHSHSTELDDLDKKISNLNWEDLINNCGAKVMVENSARANEIFNRKFARKLINWKGYFLSAHIQAFNPFDFNPEHVLNLNIRMIPSESINNADLFLSLNSVKYKKFLSEIRMLKTGDPIEFKATFETLGNEWRPHHLHLIDIKRIKDFIDAEKKLILFKGVEFDIEGHLKNEKEILNAQIKNENFKVNNITDVNVNAVRNNNFTKMSNESKEESEIINRNNTH